MESGRFGESIIVVVSGQSKKIYLWRDSFQNVVRHKLQSEPVGGRNKHLK